MEYEEYEYRDQIREARAICFSALLSIVRACKNLESLKTDGVVGDLNSEWACGIAELPKLNHLAIDFGGTDHLELDTISRLGRSSAKNIYIERFWGLGVKGTPLDELPRTPGVLDSQDVALSAPREKRGIVLSLQCCRLSHRELDVVLTHLTQGHNGRLGSVHLGGAVYPHRIDAGGSINLNRLLKRFGSGVKELTVDDPWRWTAGGSELVAGVSGLASVCPNLEKVEFGQDELDYWAKDVFPESVKVISIRNCDGLGVKLDIESSRVGGKSKRIARKSPTSEVMTCHRECMAQLKVSIYLRHSTHIFNSHQFTDRLTTCDRCRKTNVSCCRLLSSSLPHQEHLAEQGIQLKRKSPVSSKPKG